MLGRWEEREACMKTVRLTLTTKIRPGVLAREVSELHKLWGGAHTRAKAKGVAAGAPRENTTARATQGPQSAVRAILTNYFSIESLCVSKRVKNKTNKQKETLAFMLS